jgi:outer membrane murein-binding lipoprotein Lpp
MTAAIWVSETDSTDKENNMNKAIRYRSTIIIILSVTISLLLAGCSNTVTTTTTASNALPAVTEVAAGIIKLEDTTNAVTVSQATELLTLWEGYQSLSNSDTVSTVELEALVKQIQGSLSAEQLQAIKTMGLTEQTVSEYVQTLTVNAQPNMPVVTPGTSSLSQAAPGGGPGGPGGTPGGGDSVMSTIDGGGAVMQGTAEATQPAASTLVSQVDGRLLQALIQMLQSRSQGSG